MKKIIQLNEHEYDRLIRLAELNEQRINDEAQNLWKTKGVTEITITLDIKEDWFAERRIECDTSFWTKEDKFRMPENVRSRFREIIEEYVLRIAEKRMGNPVKLVNKINKEYKAIAYFKNIMIAIAASGWVAFITYLCYNKMI